MTRPRGTFSGFRAGMLRAAESLCAQHGAVTWHDLLTPMLGTDFPAPAEAKLVRNTWTNALRAGDLRPVCTKTVPGVCRPMVAAVPAAVCGAVASDAAAELADRLRGWAGFE